ncbi:MAG TPA: ATP-binding protein [Steroidobacteraceae bacterium]|nr:ATP-binding protein [Steroidobacteraceae bacterium]
MDQRALVWAVGRDGPLTCAFLAEAGFETQQCRDIAQLCNELARGAGALIVAGELLSSEAVAQLQECLARQPPWSDVPIIVVAGTPDEGIGPVSLVEELGSVAVLHRPLSLDTLASGVSAALRARRRQYQVRDLLQQREEADRRREEFLAMLAHELRNPLAPIRTGLQVLRLSDCKATTTRTHSIIERQVANLARLVDDLLDVSRITRGKILLRKEHICVFDMLKQSVDGHAALAAEKGLKVQVTAPDETLVVEADPTRLEQMVGNVLTNAIKFTPSNGTITLAAQRAGSFIAICVRDSGIGIPQHMLAQIFELFAQTDRPLDRTQGGLGIGLTIVKSLAELHGGSVEARSEGEGQGTELVIRLPAATVAASTGHASPLMDDDPDKRSRRILVVEDNRDAAEVLASYLRAGGHTVHVAYDGGAGFTAALREQPDVVICDIGLPGIDGYEFARRLRAEPRLRRCLLVAVTGYGEPRDRQRGVEAGFAHYLTKPADPREIERLVVAE